MCIIILAASLFINFIFIALRKFNFRMRFSKSQRVLHQQNQFIPPCNTYNPQIGVSSNKVLTGSLKGPSFSNKNTFGYTQRFNLSEANIIKTPGPGSYNLKEKQNQLNQNKIKKQHIKFRTIKNEDSSPSIPYNIYGKDADQDQQQYIYELKMAEDKTKAQKIVMKSTSAFSFAKGQRNSLLEKKNINYIPRQKLAFIEQQDQYHKQFKKDSQDKQMKKTAIIWKQKIQRSNERRRQIISIINPDFVPSLQLIDLMAKKKTMYNPGPGQYSKQQQQAGSSIHKHIAGAATFAESQRFSIDKQTILGPGRYQVKNAQRQKGFSFGRSQKNIFFQENAQSNSEVYRFYIDPQQKTGQNNSFLNKIAATKQFVSPFGSGAARLKQNETYHQQKDSYSTAASRISHMSQRSESSQPYRDVQIQKMKSQKKFIRKIKNRLNKQFEDDLQQQGLLGIQAMVDTIF